METLELVIPDKDKALEEFKRGDVALLALVEKHKGKKIAGIEDRAGLRAVHEARMELKAARVNIEKDRKGLKEVAIKFGNAVDTEAKRLTAIVVPLEDDYERQESAIGLEKDRIKLAEEKARRERVQVRINAFVLLGVAMPADLDTMTDEDFQASYAQAKLIVAQREAAAAAEAKRLADEAEARRLERVELDRQRAEQDAIRKEQEEKARALKEHEDRIKAQELEQRRAAELDEAKKAAAERARIETEERIAREQEARRLKDIADAKHEAEMNAEAARIETERVARDEAAKKKAEEEKPLRDKLMAVVTKVDGLRVYGPVGPWIKANAILETAMRALTKLANGPLE